jgi:hypothetical protein
MPGPIFFHSRAILAFVFLSIVKLGPRLMGAELLADTVDEKFDPAAPWAHIDIKMFPVSKKLAQVSQPESPTAASFVEFLCSYVLKPGFAAGALHRMRFIVFGHDQPSFFSWIARS